jgi:hypothetical protein
LGQFTVIATGPVEAEAALLALTEAEFEIPEQFADELVAVTCAEIEPPEASAPGVQVSVCTPPLVAMLQVASELESSDQVKPAGSASVSVNPVAARVPLFEAPIV